MSFLSTAFVTTFLELASLARYLQTLMILVVCYISKVPVALVTGDLSVGRDALGDGLARISRRVAPVLRTSLTIIFAHGAHVSLSHGRRQVRDDVKIIFI